MNRQLRHNSNPVLTWCVSNVVAKVHPEGAIMPSKRQSKRKIDGVTATVIALSTWLALGAEEIEEESVYEHRGILTI